MKACYPSYTAGKCMNLMQIAGLTAVTAVLTVLWLPILSYNRLVKV